MSETQFTIWVFIDEFDDLALYELSLKQFIEDLRSEILKNYKLEGYTIELWKLACSTKLHPYDNRKERVIASKKTKLKPTDTISTVLSSINDAIQVFVAYKPPPRPPKRSLSQEPVDDRQSKRFHFEEQSYMQAVYQGQQAMAPSSVSQLRCQQRDFPIYNGRPDYTYSGPPIAIYHEAFGKFKDSLSNDSLIPPPEIYSLVQELFAFSTEFYVNEGGRSLAVTPILGQLLETSFSKIVHEDRTAADGSIQVIFRFGDDHTGFEICLVEFKNEIGTVHGDPSQQVGFSCRKVWVAEKLQKLRDQCCCPTFLIAIAGPHIMVSGSVFTDKFIVQSLTPFLPLYAQPLEGYHQVHLVAKVLFALRTALADLTKYYQTLPRTQSSSPLPSRYFPYIPTAVDVPGLKFDHRLLHQQSWRSIFAARDANGRELVVKYVKTYSEEAHSLLAAEGLAPELLYCCDIPGGLKMVIMARIQGRNIAETSPDKIPRTVIDAVRKAINILHSKDYVFGDLRKANVVVCDSGGMLIDFDWCDKEGKATYPLLNPDITWHRDASAGRLIRKEHDSYMLTLLEKDSE